MPEPRRRCYALVPCAGVGERAQAGGPKQYAQVAGQSVVAHTLAALMAVAALDAVLVVLAPDDLAFERHAPSFVGDRAWVARCGGATRAASVAHGLAELRRRGAVDGDWVLVHDAARCLVRPAWVESLIEACSDDEVGGLLALPLGDTLKQATSSAQPRAAGPGAASTAAGDRVAATVPREGKWLAQTPQMFTLGLLERALVAAGTGVSDESSAIEALGLAPRLVRGDLENLKLTWPADFALAERLLETRR